MQKIPTLFVRDENKRNLVTQTITPGCEWVLAGEGLPTRKWDGTACLVRGGQLFKRYDAKGYLDHTVDGRAVYASHRDLPEGFVPAQNPDPATGHWPGWVPVGGESEDRWHREAFVLLDWPHDAFSGGAEVLSRDDRVMAPVGVPDGTYELVGPKVQGNPEGFERHVLLPHGRHTLPDVPRDFDGLREYLREQNIEGIVWWNPDGRMCKIKGKDFGIKRGEQ